MPEVNKIIYNILRTLRDSMSADEFDENRIAPRKTGNRQEYKRRNTRPAPACRIHRRTTGNTVHRRNKADTDRPRPRFDTLERVDT